MKAIDVTKLSASLSRVLRRVRRGERVTVLYRGRPVFQVVPLDSSQAVEGPLEADPLFRAEAVGRSRLGETAAEHDALLYRW